MCYFKYEYNLISDFDPIVKTCDKTETLENKIEFLFSCFVEYYAFKTNIKMFQCWKQEKQADFESEISKPETVLHGFLTHNNNDQENEKIITGLFSRLKRDPYMTGAKICGIEYFKEQKRKIQEELKLLKQYEKTFSLMPHSSYKKAYLSGIIGRVKRIKWIIKKLERV